MFPTREPRGRGPPSKHLVKKFYLEKFFTPLVGSSSSGFWIRESGKEETPSEGGDFFFDRYVSRATNTRAYCMHVFLCLFICCEHVFVYLHYINMCICKEESESMCLCIYVVSCLYVVLTTACVCVACVCVACVCVACVCVSALHQYVYASHPTHTRARCMRVFLSLFICCEHMFVYLHYITTYWCNAHYNILM